MKSNSFLGKFFSNWVVKVISLLAAILLYTLNSFNTLETLVLEVPLKVILPDAFALASPHRDTITFTITGKSEAGIEELTAEDFLALAELPEDKIEAGDVKVYISEERRGKALDFQGVVPLDITMQPPMVVLKIEKRSEKSVPVVTEVTGGPEEGYAVIAWEIYPQRVILIGAASRLKLIDQVRTEPISYHGYRKDFYITSHLILPDPLVRIKDVTSVEFSGYVEEMLTLRTISDVPLVPEFVNSNLMINGTLPAGEITMKVPNQVLRNLRKESVRLLVDCANINRPGRYQLKTTPDIPANAILILHTPQAVEVDFIERR